ERDGGVLVGAKRPRARHIDRAVDLGRIALAAALGDSRPDRVDDDLLAGADFAPEAARRHRLLARHEGVPARLLDLGRDGGGEVVGPGTLHPLAAGTDAPLARGP